MKNKWPALSYEDAKETYETFQLWTQVLGKIKVVTLPWINHAWNSTLRVTPTGLTTSTLPDRDRHFQIDLDFVHHQLKIITDAGEEKEFELHDGLSVADFYYNTFKLLEDLNIRIKINPRPNEIENAVPFYDDDHHRSYDADEIKNFHKALLYTQDIFAQFRAEFRGKCSPVHFFWGAIDLAVSRFSGRPAPVHPGGIPNFPDSIARECYSREVSSAGFWPGSTPLPYAAYYSYIYPEPEGFRGAKVKPSQAYYHRDLGEFILPYEAMRQAENPGETLLDFLHTTYNAAAGLAKWDREQLESL